MCVFDHRPAPPSAGGVGSTASGGTAVSASGSSAVGGSGAGVAAVGGAGAASGASAAKSDSAAPFDPAAAELPISPPFGVLIRAWPTAREQAEEIILRVAGLEAVASREAVSRALLVLVRPGAAIGSSEPLVDSSGSSLHKELRLLARLPGGEPVLTVTTHAEGPFDLGRPSQEQAVELYRGLQECRFDAGTAARYINERAFKSGGFDVKTQLEPSLAPPSAAARAAVTDAGVAEGGAGEGAAGGAGAAPERPARIAEGPFSTATVQWTAFKRE